MSCVEPIVITQEPSNDHPYMTHQSETLVVNLIVYIWNEPDILKIPLLVQVHHSSFQEETL